MLRIAGTLLMILFAVLFQTSFIGLLPYIETVPNMLLIITFSIGILRGRTEGIIYGVICGLSLDLISGELYGFNGLFFMYIGYICGFLHHLFEIDVPLVPIILATITDIFYHLYIFVFKFMIRGRINLGSYIQSIILPELFMTVAFGIVIYGIMFAGNKAIENYEKRSALKFV